MSYEGLGGAACVSPVLSLILSFHLLHICTCSRLTQVGSLFFTKTFTGFKQAVPCEDGYY